MTGAPPVMVPHLQAGLRKANLGPELPWLASRLVSDPGQAARASSGSPARVGYTAYLLPGCGGDEERCEPDEAVEWELLPMEVERLWRRGDRWKGSGRDD